MHELGVVMEVARTVEEFARENGLTTVDTIVLQIGELSSMIPKYIEDCYPAAVDGTMLQDTALRVEVLPGMGMCKSCGKPFRLLEHDFSCPQCGSRKFDALGGKEFMIKEIIAN